MAIQRSDVEICAAWCAEKKTKLEDEVELCSASWSVPRSWIGGPGENGNRDC
jgi:hypothetical protein